MPKSFRELSSRHKNRRLQAYEKHERQPILQHVNRPIIDIEVDSLQSLTDVNVPLRQCTVPDDSTSGNALNVFSIGVASSNIHDIIVEEETSSNVHHIIVEKPENKENIEENFNETLELSNWLCSWILKHNITHTALSELLNKLRTCGYYDLPKNARTLLNTPRNSIVEVWAENESFFHYGLKN